MYFIASGQVEVRVEPKAVRLGAGSFFGEFALLDGSPRKATVVTTVPSTLLILEVSDFRALTAHHPNWPRRSSGKPRAAGIRRRPTCRPERRRRRNSWMTTTSDALNIR
jgi:hypothetical protein